jgi:hypothetical protein
VFVKGVNMKETAYNCEKCQKEISVPQGEKIPFCCGLPMTPKLEACTRPFNAESARLDGDDEPCDDGTDGGN